LVALHIIDRFAVWPLQARFSPCFVLQMMVYVCVGADATGND